MFLTKTDCVTSQAIVQVFALYLVINIVTESKTIYSNISKHAENGIENNQWELEDQLCNLLEQQNFQICVCQISYENLLSLVCNATSLADKYLNLLDVSFTSVNKFENFTNFQIDTIELIGFSNFNKNENKLRRLVWPNVTVNTLKIFDSDKQLIQLSQMSEKLRTTLHTLYIANVNIGEEVFSFISQFNNLRRALFSNLSFESVIDSTINSPNGTCFTSLRKLSLNYDCAPIDQPVTNIKPGIFKSLCNLSLLDLSCLGLKHVPSGLLKLNFPLNFKSNAVSLTVDLSHNQLTSISEGIADLRKMQNNFSHINLNLNYNPFTEIHKKEFAHFKEISNNNLEIWQNSKTTKLNCSSVANAWLINKNFIQSFCNVNESQKPILVNQLTNNNNNKD